MPDEPLPEGTDSILDEDGHEAAGATAAELADDIALEQEGKEEERNAAGGTSDAGDLRNAFFGKFDELRDQATDRAFALAQTGKDRATAALDDFAKTVEDAAGEIDSRIGSQYGDYARRAAESIGGFSDAFKGKDIDELFTEARDLVKKSPAVAIGAAAALGFVVARLVKAGLPETAGTDSARPDDRAA